jgi:hypothetical protein
MNYRKEMNSVQNRYFNFDGFEDSNGGSASAQNMLNAEGVTASAVSTPYILNIANSTTADVSSVEVLYASTRIVNSAVTGVTFTYGYANFGYNQFLATLLVRPFACGGTRLISTSTAQIQKTFTITTYSPDGSSVAKAFVPTYDSYQQQTGQIDMPYEYLLDANTSLIISTLVGSATLTLHLYPSRTVSQIGQLTGSGVRSLAAPSVNPALGK